MRPRAPSDAAPRSFPGKLAAFLLHRARTFGFDAARAPVVIPTELIEDNGDKLREIVVTLAQRWNVEPAFLPWLEHVRFCNTLVDRIVPGAPSEAYAAELRSLLPYDDGMTTICEPYRLFAIEGDAELRERLRFPAADAGVIVAESIRPYRLRKVRLLNGAHTSFVSLALLAGCTTVREAVEHPALGAFLRAALLDEIVPSVDVPGAEQFAREVMDRFANPFLQHQLWDITLQGTTKLQGARGAVDPRLRATHGTLAARARTRLRGLPRVPGWLAPGAASRGRRVRARRRDGRSCARLLVAEWTTRATGSPAFVRAVSADVELWGADLSTVPGFVEQVAEHLHTIRSRGARRRDRGARASLRSVTDTAIPRRPTHRPTSAEDRARRDALPPGVREGRCRGERRGTAAVGLARRDDNQYCRNSRRG